jgi:hypothetical protein
MRVAELPKSACQHHPTLVGYEGIERMPELVTRGEGAFWTPIAVAQNQPAPGSPPVSLGALKPHLLWPFQVTLTQALAAPLLSNGLNLFQHFTGRFPASRFLSAP